MNTPASDPAHRARAVAETMAREAYGRLLGILARRDRDIAAAEDALAEAFATALRVWPERGVPDAPEAWLLVVARRWRGRSARTARARTLAADALSHVTPAHVTLTMSPDDEPMLADPRLALMFVCAHPAIDASIRAPLMLQTVLGLDAGKIAAAFLVAPPTMGQRLVRAKTKIRDAAVPFEMPDRDSLAPRLGDVLDAIYVAYNAGWDVSGPTRLERSLVDEAIYLVRLLVDLLPDEPEPKGLLALMLYCEARRPARRDRGGRYVPLTDQDPMLWSRERIVEAEHWLTAAAAARRFGRYQTEAAIQSLHVQRGVTGRTDGSAIIGLYDLLARLAPSLGAAVARAAALAEAGDLDAAKAALDALQGADVATYQPYWAVRAHVLQRIGHPDAGAARETSIALAGDPSVQAHLAARRH